jgi:hypothetical protein
MAEAFVELALEAIGTPPFLLPNLSLLLLLLLVYHPSHHHHAQTSPPPPLRNLI